MLRRQNDQLAAAHPATQPRVKRAPDEQSVRAAIGKPSDRFGSFPQTVQVADGRVIVSVEIPAERAAALETWRAESAANLRRRFPGWEPLVLLTAQAPGNDRAQGTDAHPPRLAVGQGGIAHVVAVASGKGGVGKSTTACNLALALRANGLRVGLLDADIYGPSAPRLFGLHGSPRVLEGRTLVPMDGYGVKVMSIGFLVDPETAMVWRGPMVMSAITQMLREVAWGSLDVLVVDLPPGTGDAQLAVAQSVPLSGAVIVSTPQDLALMDVRRGIVMFAKLEVPILGLIENMAYFDCTTCGTRHALFGSGGAEAEASRLGLPFLGAIPLTLSLREASDSGRPTTALDPDGPLSASYRAIARTVWQAVAEPHSAAP